MQIELEKVKKIPRWWRFVPFFSVDVAATVYPFMYFPESIFIDLHKADPDKANIGILLHEQVHLDRQIKHGVCWWNIKYIFSKEFRLAEELEAIKVQMAYMKENGLVYDIDRKAKQFNSSLYLWVLPEDKSKPILTELWNSLG